MVDTILPVSGDNDGDSTSAFVVVVVAAVVAVLPVAPFVCEAVWPAAAVRMRGMLKYV